MWRNFFKYFFFFDKTWKGLETKTKLKFHQPGIWIFASQKIGICGNKLRICKLTDLYVAWMSIDDVFLSPKMLSNC